MRPKISLKMNC